MTAPLVPILFAAAVFLLAGCGAAQPNLPTPTFPDAAHWRAPEPLEGDWSLQENRLTGHWRLLDESNIRRAWGTREQCLRSFETLYLVRSSTERRLDAAEPEPNIPLPTLEGPQFWSDHRLRQGWRLQENARTGHWRLLDPLGVRRGWGRRAAMEAMWEETVVPLLGPPPERIVVCLNGIVRSKESWAGLQLRIEDAAESHDERLEVLALNYPSTQVTNAEAAVGIADVIDDFPPETRVAFVCHSMGGLLCLTYLATRTDPASGAAYPASRAPHPVEQVITLGTPFAGSPIADRLADTWYYQLLYGPAGQELTTERPLLARYEWPDVPVVAIAGSNPPDGYSGVLEGDDDGTVEITSALPERAAFKYTVPIRHSFLMYDDQAVALVLRHLFDERPAVAAAGPPQ